jgi:hypothetical protein
VLQGGYHVVIRRDGEWWIGWIEETDAFLFGMVRITPEGATL